MDSKLLRKGLLVGLAFAAFLGIKVHTASAQATSTAVYTFQASGPTTSELSSFGRVSPNQYYYSQTYQPTNTQFVCSVDIGLIKNNSPTGNVSVSLYVNTTNSTSSIGDIFSTGTLLATSTALDVSTLTGSYALHNFLWSNGNCQGLYPQNTYVFAVVPTITPSNTVNLGLAGGNDTASPQGGVFSSTSAGSSWSAVGANYSMYLKLLGLPNLAVDYAALGGATSTAIGYNDCSSYSGGLFSSSTLQGLFCYGQNALTGLANFILYPHAVSQAFLLNAYTDFQEVFPFNVFFSLSTTVEEAVDSYTGTPSSLNLTIGFPNLPGEAYSTSSISILSGTTLTDNLFDSTTLNWWYNLLLMFFSVVLAWTIYKVMWHPHE